MKSNVLIKEKLYLSIMILFSALLYLAVYYYLADFSIVFLIYGSAFIVPLCLLSSAKIIGDLRNNSVQVSAHQFPEIFEILKKQSEKLGLIETPTVYVMQNGGFLNALAMKLLKQNYIVIYSEVLEAAYQEGMPVVEFIIGHELGHIKRGHVGNIISFFIFPAKLTPILGDAYSRACEYTCDSIGYDLSPNGAQKGLLILSVGKNLYKKVDVNELVTNFDKKRGFVTWFAEIFSTHPALIKRITKLKNVEQTASAYNNIVTSL